MHDAIPIHPRLQQTVLSVLDETDIFGCRFHGAVLCGCTYRRRGVVYLKQYWQRRGKKNNQKVMFFLHRTLLVRPVGTQKNNGVGSRSLHVDARRGRRRPQLKTQLNPWWQQLCLDSLPDG